MLGAVWDAVNSAGNAEYHRIQESTSCSGSYYRKSLVKLKNQGLLRVTQVNGQKFLELTKKDELKVLLDKCQLPHTEPWDKKWRVIIFDIPEDCNSSGTNCESCLCRTAIVNCKPVFILALSLLIYWP